jgi:hypothetical protein
MKRVLFTIGLLFPMITFCQTQSLWSKDSINYPKALQIHSSQYASPLFGKTSDFYISDSVKKGNTGGAGVHTWLVKDFNQDGYSDIFLGFFGSEQERMPFLLLIYDTISGKYVDKSFLIKNNIGQKFNRKTMAADLNGDGIPDMVAAAAVECDTCSTSSFDIVLSDKSTNTWNQKTLKLANRFKSEGYFHGVALGDVDNDGDIDIVLANENTAWGGVITFTNDGKGNFTEKYSMNFFDKTVAQYGIAWTTELVDINKDGFIDLLYYHDSAYRGIAYGDGTGYFGNKLEQRFPKTKYSGIMDYDAVDLDNDGDLDLILSTTDYLGWELIFLENKGNDADGKVIWVDRSFLINQELAKNGFYTDGRSKNWLPYLSLQDLNNDGIIDLATQTPFNNFEDGWIVYGKGNWTYSYIPNMIPEVQNKPNVQLLSDGKIQLKWKKIITQTPASNTKIASWKVYFNNKPFGDRHMVKSAPIIVDTTNTTLLNDSIRFVTNLPYDTTYMRISVVDSNKLETPLSDTALYSCSLPPAPVVQNQTICSNQSLVNLLDYVKSNFTLQWYDSLIAKSPRTTITPINNSVGTHYYYVSALNKCESYNKSILTLTINKSPDPPSIIRDISNNLVSSSMIGNTWYKDGNILTDTSQKIKPQLDGSYTIKIIQNGCASTFSAAYYYLVTALANLSNGQFIHLYPNPANNELIIDYILTGQTQVSVKIFDINGRILINKSKVIKGATLSVNQLISGTYFVQVLDKNNQLLFTDRLIKQ